MFRKFLHRHWSGPGGIGALLPIAMPMIVSNIFDTAMMFVDRLYLSYVGKEHIAACMNGGLTAWSCTIFFVGVISYVSAMVARSHGAGHHKECPVIVGQGLRLALLAYPVILLLALLAARTFAWAGHDLRQQQLETTYFWYSIIGGSLLALLRTPLAAFFSGLGKTRIILWASMIALLVNVVLNYLLIFGKFGFPRLEIAGAAIGTLASGLTVVVILFCSFLAHCRRQGFNFSASWRYNDAICKALLKFGFPNGLDGFLGTTAFNAMVTAFHGFGADAAAAVTVVLNWDLLSFFPLLGTQIGITTLVGQRLGAGDPQEAERATFSGLKLNLLYTLFLSLCFVFLARPLVAVFTPENQGIDYQAVVSLAVPMLRWAAVYLLLDGCYLAFAGALRGGGDTLWAMLIGLAFHWVLAGNTLLAIYWFDCSALASWRVWVCSVMFGWPGIYLRFRTGKWKHIKIFAFEHHNSAG
ncbi:MAG: MATE family efflux transporter [Oligosphaeraceae bacterium]|nr:MATE family efflux transporter [Oligosphaeraceae bacterium]